MIKETQPSTDASMNTCSAFPIGILDFILSMYVDDLVAQRYNNRPIKDKEDKN